LGKGRNAAIYKCERTAGGASVTRRAFATAPRQATRPRVASRFAPALLQVTGSQRLITLAVSNGGWRIQASSSGSRTQAAGTRQSRQWWAGFEGSFHRNCRGKYHRHLWVPTRHGQGRKWRPVVCQRGGNGTGGAAGAWWGRLVHRRGRHDVFGVVGARRTA